MRLIEARELIRRISELPDLRTISTGTIGKIIKECSTIDAVPVVRCKNCARSDAALLGDEYVYCKHSGLTVLKSDYCSYGEPKV